MHRRALLLGALLGACAAASARRLAGAPARASALSPRAPRAAISGSSAEDTRPHVAVVGGGWGGWGAAKALCEQGCRVTLLDAVPDPTGATPMLSPTGKPVEPGVRGFWRDYPNINRLVAELGLDEADVFTPCTNSSFYGPEGLEATAPVFSESAFPTLPSPLGQVLATFPLFERLPLPDRASMVGLLYATLDFARDEKTFEAYDRMSAHDLFVAMGLSQRLVDDFIRPTLLVGLFKPPEELSAAVTMELLYYYALAHQDSFDVRWIKRRSNAELLVAPLAQRLQQRYALDVRGGAYVTSLKLERGRAAGLTYKRAGGGGGAEGGGAEGAAEEELHGLSAVVLALGAKGMGAVVRGSPELARACPELAAAGSMPTIDVISCRIWLDRYVPTRTPANVLSRFPALRGAGGTFFMLDQLQAEDEGELWAGEEPQGSVLACDFYNAGALLPMADADLVALLLDDLLPAAVPGFRGARALDSWVGRYPGAVSWFAPGSYARRPPLQTSVPNLVCAGDWVKMGAREHGAKGLCQERAFVSGLQAAGALGLGAQPDVLPVREDEPQVVGGRALNKAVMGALDVFGLGSPWVR